MENNRLFDLFYRCNQKVSTDSRKIEEGCLYIALKGESFDGNTFAHSAIEKGAKYAIVDNQEYVNNDTIYYVNDGLIFLQQLANFHRSKFEIPIIGITGSNGKTTSKELIAQVLKQKFNIHFTSGNLNNHIGVPLTLLQLNNDHDIGVIEMGASKPGDIKELCDIANPTHGIITNIGAAHLEGFGGFDGVLKTKTELYDSIKNIGGTIFCNADDPTLIQAVPKTVEVIRYGSQNKDQCSVTGTLEKMTPHVSLSWKNSNYSSPIIETNIIGRYNFYNFLAAIAIGNYFEIEPELINKGVTSYTPNNNRSQIITTERNTIIMDAYNANPTSVKSALESFCEMPHENKLFILGDMFELGEDSIKLHEEIILLSNSLKLQGVFIGRIFSDFANKYTNNLFFEDKQEAIAFFESAQPNKNLILIKGSRGMQLEELKVVF